LIELSLSWLAGDARCLWLKSHVMAKNEGKVSELIFRSRAPMTSSSFGAFFCKNQLRYFLLSFTFSEIYFARNIRQPRADENRGPIARAVVSPHSRQYFNR
jgi:hypothetical protein